jgi:hypothetical protein
VRESRPEFSLIVSTAERLPSPVPGDTSAHPTSVRAVQAQLAGIITLNV